MPAGRAGRRRSEKSGGEEGVLSGLGGEGEEDETLQTTCFPYRPRFF